MRTRSRIRWTVPLLVLVVGAVGGCDGGDGGSGASSGAPASSPSAATGTQPTASASPDAAADPAPGTPCEPGSHRDCSDATGTEGDPFRIIAGYADCVESLGADEADGLCTDLDGDDHAGYADAG
jgi:hypothetical protein